ncbi:uncharacterized protein FMAN_08257 [Fusarium mangiferae]|uniref:Uncharacterized protein n=1 Tax=Fusarium mangiferae TaxID=192010 RepID=A0A1L7U2E6_FUSMA|nr:uncharacterized protein FMAN_08257 [Fusarium mangiferae]CVL02165.1 uncharacterized protein FMAN_08257 [Fusarium mangiferae]
MLPRFKPLISKQICTVLTTLYKALEKGTQADSEDDHPHPVLRERMVNLVYQSAFLGGIEGYDGVCSAAAIWAALSNRVADGILDVVLFLPRRGCILDFSLGGIRSQAG